MNDIPPITIDQIVTLGGTFAGRASRTPDKIAYREYDESAGEWREYTWSDMASLAARWQKGFKELGLQTGDRVAMMLPNCTAWVLFDQAAFGLGLVTVPLYTNDRAENMAYILEDCGAEVLLIDGEEQWKELHKVAERLTGLRAIITLDKIDAGDTGLNMVTLSEWLPEESDPFVSEDLDPEGLATIVYTSGTTGPPKGVMLSHRNILWNVKVSLKALPVTAEDEFLSFLPLSHMFERTTGYYLTIAAGSTVTFTRSIDQLAEDLGIIRPTILVSVPRIFERIYSRLQQKLAHESAVKRFLFNKAVDLGWQAFEHSQGRAGWTPGLIVQPLLDKLVGSKVRERLGGRLKFAASGGAALSPDIARTFVGLGIPIVQGYGLTETSPVVSGNRLENNIPASVGQPLEEVEVRVGDDAELLVRSPGVMMGYWHNDEATRDAITDDGWFRTGDQVRIGEQGHIFITGRLKEVLVLSNGEKVPPADMEAAIALDPLIEQVMVIGDSRPFLTALAVLNEDGLQAICAELGLDPENPDTLSSEELLQDVLMRIKDGLKEFPGYARLHRVALMKDPWSIENGMMTPTMKLKRKQILSEHAPVIETLYAGH